VLPAETFKSINARTIPGMEKLSLDAYEYCFSLDSELKAFFHYRSEPKWRVTKSCF
jgi:hypothetical protein